MNTVGKRIRFIRGGMSQAEFAEKTKINKSTLGRYERDVSSPDAKSIQAVCESFLIQSEWLLTGKGAPEEISNNTKLIGSTLKDEPVTFVQQINGNEYNKEILDPIKNALEQTLIDQSIQISERHFDALSLVLYEEFIERVLTLAGPSNRYPKRF